MRILLYGIYAAAISTVQAITQKTNEVEEVLRRRPSVVALSDRPASLIRRPQQFAPPPQPQNDMKTPTVIASQGSEISKEEWASTLFGERGVLSGIFQMLDQQRKQTQSPQQDGSGKINSNEFDFKRIMDALLKGADGNSFGDPGPELPEFLGLCNRLSCGDIYKAIDKFRRSEFFSNFQTALSLLHDPNGWETLGNLLSNPELISQFTAGTGMEELFGSALGQAKKESVKTKEKTRN